MPNRVKFDISGTIYTLPLNPLAYDPKDNQEHRLVNTIDGAPVRFVPFFDSRNRVMQWRNIPNTSTYQTMVANLQSMIGISGVRIQFQDLNIGGNSTVWKDIIVHDVAVKLRQGAGPYNAISHLAYDIDLIFGFRQMV